jgi:plastocyanin
MKTYLSFTRMKFVWVSLLLAAAITLVLAACGGSSTAATSSSTPAPTPTTAPTPTPTPATSPTPVAVVNVKIVEKNEHYSFSPATLTIKAGTEVIWTNVSDAPHTVTSDTSAFTGSNSFKKNQTFMTIFTTPGTYTYHCSIHTYMMATITVTS